MLHTRGSRGKAFLNPCGGNVGFTGRTGGAKRGPCGKKGHPSPSRMYGQDPAPWDKMMPGMERKNRVGGGG
ncbi:hypothetical protein B4135_1640 [Caldibacillus debilis]|uniref:Uncharacterized protein n=1 Tax=Caldibacillus debilis TaxID=301148 RepID=A0A150MBL4_9BACI|nr:hypothetical protein B4135_1640 [Caldibacillus debilis]